MLILLTVKKMRKFGRSNREEEENHHQIAVEEEKTKHDIGKVTVNLEEDKTLADAVRKSKVFYDKSIPEYKKNISSVSRFFKSSRTHTSCFSSFFYEGCHCMPH